MTHANATAQTARGCRNGLPVDFRVAVMGPSFPSMRNQFLPLSTEDLRSVLLGAGV
jgi:hypothetical protein